MNSTIKEKLIKARRAVKRKLEKVKSHKIDSEQILEDTYRPLTKTLRDIIKHEPASLHIKKEPFELKKPISPKIERYQTNNNTSDPNVETQENAEDQSEGHTVAGGDDQEVNPQSSSDRRRGEVNFGPLPKQYIEGFLKDTLREFDDGIQGIKYDPETNKYKIGNSEIVFNRKDNNFTINGTKYTGTLGIYELLFKRQPIGFTAADKIKYGEIITQTAAVNRNKDSSAQRSGNRSNKYHLVKEILDEKQARDVILTPTRTRMTSQRTKIGQSLSNYRLGNGFMTYNTKPIEYIHWDDPNELVDRLRLLIASEQAGNNAHTNEIVSIIQELREANIIA